MAAEPTRGGGLPSPVDPIIGREEDLAEVAEVLLSGGSRLVTLTGPGGVGKTRLALAVAQRWVSRDGVRFVPLAGVREPALVLPELARAFGLAAAAPVEVVAVLGGLDVLVVLDNFEHLTEAGVQVADLLAGATGVSVLVTSRTPLRIRGEVEYRVNPLGLPPLGCADPALVAASPAAALLVSRGRAVRRDLALTPTQASAVAEICHRLSGLPLAIELAAAGLRTLDPVRLLAHLDEVVSASGALDLPARQHTLRATLDWSYHMLSAEVAVAFRRLSVFVEGFTLEAAGHVVAAPDARRLVDDLATHSLCTAESGPDGSLRYRMLEVVAHYGRELLAGEEADIVKGAHASYFLKFAEAALSDTHGREQIASSQRLDLEAGNLRAALEWTIAQRQGELAGRVIWALWMHWWMRGHSAWARPRFATALTLPMSDAIRARVLIAFGGIAEPSADAAAVERCYIEAARLSSACGDREAHASATLALGTSALRRQDYRAAEEQLRRAVAAAEDAGQDSVWYAGHAHVLLGAAQRFNGRLDSAVESVRVGLDLARARRDAVATTIALYNLSQTYLSRGEPQTARTYLVEAAELCVQAGDIIDLANVFTALACACSGSPRAAATLFGAADVLRSEAGPTGYGFYEPDLALARHQIERTRHALGEAAYVEAFDVGQQLTLTQAVEFARSSGAVQ